MVSAFLFTLPMALQLGGAKKCKEIWLAIRKADFRKEGILNETNINLVFERNKETVRPSY